MKKSLILYLLLLFSSIELLKAESIVPGESLSKMISLDFNQFAFEKERSEYVDFVLTFDKDNFDVILDPEFPVIDNKLRVTAFEYLNKVVKQGKEGIIVNYTPKVNALEGDYDFSIRFIPETISKGLKGNYELEDGESLVTWEKVDYYVPTPLWIVISIWSAIILVIIILLWYILTRDDMPFGKKTFKTGGTISIIDVDGNAITYNLNKKKYKYGFRLLPGSPEISLDGCKVSIRPADRRCKFKRKKRRFAIIDIVGPNPSDVLHSNENNPTEEWLYIPGPMYSNDILKCQTPNKGELRIRYYNRKINRK